MTENQGVFTIGGFMASIACGFLSSIEFGFIGCGATLMIVIVARKWIG